MERAMKRKKEKVLTRVLSKKLYTSGMMLLLFGLAPLAWSGVVLAPEPPQKTPQPQSEFPTSSFGQSPERPEASYAYASDQGSVRVGSDSTGRQPAADRQPAGFVMENQLKSATTADYVKREEARDDSKPQIIPQLEPSHLVPNKRGVQEVALIAGDLGYFPNTVFVTRDIPVRMFITGASKNTLCIMMDSFNVKKQIRTQKIEEVTFTPSLPGKYRFYCPVNGMEGTIVVKELAQAQQE